MLDEAYMHTVVVLLFLSITYRHVLSCLIYTVSALSLLPLLIVFLPNIYTERLVGINPVFVIDEQRAPLTLYVTQPASPWRS